MKLTLIILFVLFTASPSVAQNNLQLEVRSYREKHEHQILKEFVDLLSIPNIASDLPNIRKNAAAIMEMMKRRRLNPRLLEAKSANTPPAIYGEWSTPGAKRTLILYAHYDGQPTDPKQWTDTQAWQPVLRSASLEKGGQIVPMPLATTAMNPEWRLYARSASDDKAGVMAILSAFDALRSEDVKLTSNLKFLFEGEEEAGSPHLAEIIKLNLQLLQADAWIICDGPVHQSGRKQVVFGVRGDTNVDVTVYAAKRPLQAAIMAIGHRIRHTFWPDSSRL